MTASARQIPRSGAPYRPDGWLVAGAALGAMLLFSASALWGTVWEQEAHSHGPLVAAVAAWLFWSQSRPPIGAGPSGAALTIGWLLLLVGLCSFVVGRLVGIPFIEVLGLLPTAAGLVTILGGRAGWRAYWFPLLFLVFLVPLPDFALEAITGSLKNKVSWATEFLLFHAGYPIARDGVTLSIAQYRLLVADACSGLNSIVALLAMGALYLHLMRHGNRVRNVILAASIVPIAVLVNLARVIVLVLLTYHAGDEAGQGFMHGFAGLFLFALGLAGLFGLDALLGRVPALQDRGEQAR